MAEVAIVGGGVGGLAAALRIRAAGHDVTVFERNAKVGGKLDAENIDGFSFDTGPSLVTWPAVFTQLFADAGLELSHYVELKRLSRQFHYSFDDGSSFDVFDDPGLTANSIREMAGTRAEHQWRKFMKHAASVWEVSERTFLTQPMESSLRVLGRMSSPRDLWAIDSLRTLAKRAASSFDDPRLQMWLNRYATYSGSDPWKARATLSCIPHLEQRFGCWHIAGGVAALSVALDKACRDAGVVISTDADVTSILDGNGRVRGVRVDKTNFPFDAVVANVDSEHLYGSLLPNQKQKSRTRAAGRSTAGFAMLLGLRGTTPNGAHHNVMFSANQEREFREISTSGVAKKPTIYVCNSSASDLSQAPPGHENWFVLVNVAAGTSTHWNAYGDAIIDRLGVRDRIVVRKQLTPGDYEQRYSTLR